MRQGNRTSRAGPGARQKPCGRGRAWTVLVALPPLLSCGGDGPTFRGDRNGDEGLMPSLYIVNADGSGLVRLTIGADDQTPAWRR
ncbi:MAG TPA: hypothetical protein VLE53_18785 [Gemmatimonadaceae bacterium]|nr:hypothetical protein [Gemmatimonadaceae bacterium]